MGLGGWSGTFVAEPELCPVSSVSSLGTESLQSCPVDKVAEPDPAPVWFRLS